MRLVTCRKILLSPGLLVAIALLGACAGTPSPAPAPPVARVEQAPAHYRGDARSRLSQHYHAWQGTPYRMGGLNRHGIDCSGFIYITYRDVFGVVVPRTTERLVAAGMAIPLEDIRPGDLLVFRTGYKQRHVGIYLGNGQFYHASSSRGVISSNIYSPYWSDAYRESRRVLTF